MRLELPVKTGCVLRPEMIRILAPTRAMESRHLDAASDPSRFGSRIGTVEPDPADSIASGTGARGSRPRIRTTPTGPSGLSYRRARRAPKKGTAGGSEVAERT